MARAALALYEATGESAYLAAADRLANAAQDAFGDGSRRILLHGRRCDRCSAGAAPHRGRQRHARRQRHHGGGPGSAVPPDRRCRVARPGRSRAERVCRPAGSVGGHADTAGRGGSAGGSRQRRDRRRQSDRVAGSGAELRADPAVVVLRAADTGALPPDHPAFGKMAGVAWGGCLCLPAERMWPADHRSRGVVSRRCARVSDPGLPSCDRSALSG